ncbi:MAG: hypothetical protein JJE36_03655 [Coriobacteriia bacterium]|nr:hypothetical protein [Coriobacteriia bacterium]
MSTVSNIKDGLQVALDLANAANRVGDVAMLIETQQQVLQILDENRQLRDRVAELEDELAMDSQLHREGLSYYVQEDDGSKTGPVCLGCYKRDRVVSKLVQSSLSDVFCGRCKETYYLD